MADRWEKAGSGKVEAAPNYNVTLRWYRARCRSCDWESGDVQGRAQAEHVYWEHAKRHLQIVEVKREMNNG